MTNSVDVLLILVCELLEVALGLTGRRFMWVTLPGAEIGTAIREARAGPPLTPSSDRGR
ncbi:hypothetical protein QM646_00985 [Rhodococcus erythropolis]|nr:hypothetical protein [Rhodococcus erythropolis]